MEGVIYIHTLRAGECCVPVQAATSRDEYRELVGRLKEQVEVLHDALVEERAKSSSPAASVSTTSHRHQARRHRRQSLSAAGGKSRSGIIDMEASSEAGPHGDAGSEVGGSGSGSDAEGDGDGASRSGGEEGGDGVAPEAVEELVRGVASLTTRHEDALSQLQAVTAERDALQEQLQVSPRAYMCNSFFACLNYRICFWV